MITLTHLKGDEIVLNADLIESLEATPDTVITLTTGKKIVVLTDGQKIGWDLANDSSWSFLAGGFEDMPSKPQIICRTLKLPEKIRNLAVADLTLGRRVIGTDREVRINVKVANTGNGAAENVILSLQPVGSGNQPVSQNLGIIAAGAERVIEVELTSPYGPVEGATVSIREDLTGEPYGITGPGGILNITWPCGNVTVAVSHPLFGQGTATVGTGNRTQTSVRIALEPKQRPLVTDVEVRVDGRSVYIALTYENPFGRKPIYVRALVSGPGNRTLVLTMYVESGENGTWRYSCTATLSDGRYVVSFSAFDGAYNATGDYTSEGYAFSVGGSPANTTPASRAISATISFIAGPRKTVRKRRDGRSSGRPPEYTDRPCSPQRGFLEPPGQRLHTFGSVGSAGLPLPPARRGSTLSAWA